MSSNIRPLTGKNVVPGGGAGTAGGVVNRWQQVVEVAKPTLDAVLKLREARDWLEDRRKNYRSVMIDLDRVDEYDEDDAKARLAVIPEMAFLQDATRLFDDAVRKSAPQAWYHLALGTMLAGMPNAKNVAPDYQFMVVDVIMYDGESSEKGCQPGFSAAVFVSAIRKVISEEEFVPTAAKILKACQSHRMRFRQLGSDVETLIDVRVNAEQIIKEAQRQYEDLFGDDPCEPVPPRPPGWSPPVYPDDSDVPF